MKPITLSPVEPSGLLDFIFQSLPDKSRTTVRSYLRNGQIAVNGCTTRQFDQQLAVGDTVEIVFERQREVLRHPMLTVIYEDDALLVINKKAGLLSIATDKKPGRNAYAIVSDYLKREDPDARVFIVHRLDRETSGIMMFAKNKEIQEKLQHNWNENILERKYFAVTEGIIEQQEGVISSYLTESKALKVYATDHENGKLAKTAFTVLATGRENTLLELQLETGRKNQIRAHLEYVGFPIIGDKKYGAVTNPLGRVALHAGTLAFVHPVTGEEMEFKTQVPEPFLSLFGVRSADKKRRLKDGKRS